MHHPDDDKIVRFALAACADEAEHNEVEHHLTQCEACRSAVEKALDDLAVLGSVRPEPAPLVMPRQPLAPTRAILPVLRAAALVAFGVFTGLGLSEVLREEPIYISPAYSTLTTPVDSSFSCAEADATDMRVRLN
jgi:hypothetical protein